MPGVGVRTAARLLIDVASRAFASAGHLAAYAGLAPVTRRSGSSIRGELPSRRGNKQLKRAMFLSAFAALRDPVSRAYYTRKISQGKRLGSANRLCGDCDKPPTSRRQRNSVIARSAGRRRIFKRGSMDVVIRTDNAIRTPVLDPMRPPERRSRAPPTGQLIQKIAESVVKLHAQLYTELHTDDFEASEGISKLLI
jgi:Transposase IS116/IS110/IS902 family